MDRGALRLLDALACARCGRVPREALTNPRCGHAQCPPCFAAHDRCRCGARAVPGTKKNLALCQVLARPCVRALARCATPRPLRPHTPADLARPDEPQTRVLQPGPWHLLECRALTAAAGAVLRIPGPPVRLVRSLAPHRTGLAYRGAVRRVTRLWSGRHELGFAHLHALHLWTRDEARLAREVDALVDFSLVPENRTALAALPDHFHDPRHNWRVRVDADADALALALLAGPLARFHYFFLTYDRDAPSWPDHLPVQAPFVSARVLSHAPALAPLA